MTTGDIAIQFAGYASSPRPHYRRLGAEPIQVRLPRHPSSAYHEPPDRRREAPKPVPTLHLGHPKYARVRIQMANEADQERNVEPHCLQVTESLRSYSRHLVAFDPK